MARRAVVRPQAEALLEALGSQLEPKFPKSHSGFPRPLYPPKLTEEVANENIDTLRRSTREELLATLESPAIHLDSSSINRYRNLVAALVVQNGQTETDINSTLETLTEKILIYNKERFNRYHDPKALNKHLAPLGQVLTIHKDLQIETDEVEITDHLTVPMQEIHKAAEKEFEDGTTFNEKEKTVLEVFANQYWGLSIEDTIKRTHFTEKELLQIIHSINQKAEKAGLPFRITIRNGIAILVSEDNKISVPCLTKKRVKSVPSPQIHSPQRLKTREKEHFPHPGEDGPNNHTNNYLTHQLQLATPEEIEEILESMILANKTSEYTTAIIMYLKTNLEAPISEIVEIYPGTQKSPTAIKTRINRKTHHGIPEPLRKIHIAERVNLNDPQDPIWSLQNHGKAIVVAQINATLERIHNDVEGQSGLLKTLHEQWWGVEMPDTEETRVEIEKTNNSIKDKEYYVAYRNSIAILAHKKLPIMVLDPKVSPQNLRYDYETLAEVTSGEKSAIRRTLQSIHSKNSRQEVFTAAQKYVDLIHKKNQADSIESAVIRFLIGEDWGIDMGILQKTLLYQGCEKETRDMEKLIENINRKTYLHSFKIEIVENRAILTALDGTIEIPKGEQSLTLKQRKSIRQPAPKDTTAEPARPTTPTTPSPLEEKVETLTEIVLAQQEELDKLKRIIRKLEETVLNLTNAVLLQEKLKEEKEETEEAPLTITTLPQLQAIVCEKITEHTGIRFAGSRFIIPQNPISEKQIRALSEALQPLRLIEHTHPNITKRWLNTYLSKLGGIKERYAGDSSLPTNILEDLVQFNNLKR
jgi:hypothetical protein